MEDATFAAHNGPHGVMSIPLQRVTSLRRHAQAKGPYPRRTRRVHRARDAVGRVYDEQLLC